MDELTVITEEIEYHRERAGSPKGNSTESQNLNNKMTKNQNTENPNEQSTETEGKTLPPCDSAEPNVDQNALTSGEVNNENDKRPNGYPTESERVDHDAENANNLAISPGILKKEETKNFNIVKIKDHSTESKHLISKNSQDHNTESPNENSTEPQCRPLPQFVATSVEPNIKQNALVSGGENNENDKRPNGNSTESERVDHNTENANRFSERSEILEREETINLDIDKPKQSSTESEILNSIDNGNNTGSLNGHSTEPSQTLSLCVAALASALADQNVIGNILQNVVIKNQNDQSSKRHSTESEDLNTKDTRDQKIKCPNENPTEPEDEKLKRYLATLAVSLLLISCGTAVRYLGIPLHLEVQTTYLDEISWYLFYFGIPCGALLAGLTADVFGRKITIIALAGNYVTLFAMIYIFSIENIIYWASFNTGACVGASYTVVPIYIAEIAETNYRGRLGCACQMAFALGNLYVLFGETSSHTHFPLSFCVFPALFLVMCFKMPESPPYLVKKGKIEEAGIALKCLRGKSHNVDKELKTIENGLFGNPGHRISFAKAIREKFGIKSFIISIGLLQFQALSGYIILSWFFPWFLKMTRLKFHFNEFIMLFISAGGAICSAQIIDKHGRKFLLQASAGFMALSLALIAYGYLSLASKKYFDRPSEYFVIMSYASIAHLVMYATGFGPVPLIMASELLPVEIKGIGIGVSVALSSVTSFAVTSWIFYSTEPLMEPEHLFGIIAALCCTALLFVTFYVTETKGKSLGQIQNELWPKPAHSLTESTI